MTYNTYNSNRRQENYGRQPRHQHPGKKKRIFTFLLIAVVVVGGLWLILKDDATPTDTQPTAHNTQTSQKKEEEKKEPLPPVIDLQPTIDAWAAKQSGKASVVVYDLANKKTVGSLNPDEQYFAASIYKLYVAYIGYQKVADGTYSLDEANYLSDWTRGKCLDEMIRTSHSPCGERMWVELGKEALTEQLKTKYNLTGTSMVGLTTTANDAAIILQRLHERRDLNQTHTNLMLDSMKNQIYRDVLPKGFGNATVYDKVGFNLQLEYHDTGIVTLPNGRSYVVSVLTRSVGTRQMVNLAEALYAKMTK